MPYPTEQLRAHPSAYFIQDHSYEEEIARLEIQDKMLTTGMEGVFPELAEKQNVRRVLDVGCGTGGWLMETARIYPTIEKLVGADINSKMVAHASAQAKALGLDERVAFRTMDALRLLEFPSASFDLVNQRLGASWIRTWEWTKILIEHQRVCRPGGIIRKILNSITVLEVHLGTITPSSSTRSCHIPALPDAMGGLFLQRQIRTPLRSSPSNTGGTT